MLLQQYATGIKGEVHFFVHKGIQTSRFAPDITESNVILAIG